MEVIILSNLSDIIEGFIKELIDVNNDMVEIQRNVLAQQFDCSPSQINYVLTTRFNHKGYIIESKRGGGGSIKIFRIQSSKHDKLDRILNENIGDSITLSQAESLIKFLCESGIISQKEQKIMSRALSERAFSKVFYAERNRLRADILKEMIMTISEDIQ